ncbi:MAG: hypothetical protein Ta2G_15620 [Termitinemataceae bacterium]|nr:MAG: hypothetical protein Ta2G_15620 [Termitinemataceae bacterium]
MSQYHIEGSHTLSGKIKAGGNKNAALPCIAAALLTNESVTLRNVPEIEDVSVMLEVYRALGGEAEKQGGGRMASLYKKH